MTDLDAFLRWNSGHLLENRTRGAYAEWLVHRALGLDPGQHRVEWAEVDVTFGSITLEVKSAALRAVLAAGAPEHDQLPD